MKQATHESLKVGDVVWIPSEMRLGEVVWLADPKLMARWHPQITYRDPNKWIMTHWPSERKGLVHTNYFRENDSFLCDDDEQPALFHTNISLQPEKTTSCPHQNTFTS